MHFIRLAVIKSKETVGYNIKGINDYVTINSLNNVFKSNKLSNSWGDLNFKDSELVLFLSRVCNYDNMSQ